MFFFGFANVQTIESCFFSSDGFSLNFTVCCFHSNKFSPQAVHLMVVLQKHNQTRTGSVSIHVQPLMEGKIPPELLTHLLYTTYFLTGIISNFYRREWTLKSLDHISLFSCHAISIYHFFQGNFYSYVHYRGLKLVPKNL